MNRFILHFIFVTVCLFLVSCKGKIQTPEYVINETYITSFYCKDTVKQGENLKMDLTIAGFNGCDRFSHFEKITNSEIETDLKIFVKHNKNDVCTANITNIETNIALTLTSSGENFLRFRYQKSNQIRYYSVFIEE